MMYPGYSKSDVLEEYAKTFFALLNEGYRIRSENYLMLARISDLPHMDKNDRAEFYRNLEWASKHPSDILNTSGEDSSDADIKKLLG